MSSLSGLEFDGGALVFQPREHSGVALAYCPNNKRRVLQRGGRSIEPQQILTMSFDIVCEIKTVAEGRIMPTAALIDGD